MPLQQPLPSTPRHLTLGDALRQHDERRKLAYARAILEWEGFGEDDGDSGKARGLPRPIHPDQQREDEIQAHILQAEHERRETDVLETERRAVVQATLVSMRESRKEGQEMANADLCRFVQQLARQNRVLAGAQPYRDALLASWKFHGKQSQGGVPLVALDVARACIVGLLEIPEAAIPAPEPEGTA